MNEPVSMVLTERDYSNFVMNIGSQNDQHILPRIIQQSLVKSSQLLIGYSLQDVNSRGLLGSIARFWESLAPPMVIGIISPEMDVGYNYPQAKNYLNTLCQRYFKT